MPFRNGWRSNILHWANLKAAIAGVGSGLYCGKTPSLRALQGAPCEALCRFAHLWSELSEWLQNGANQQMFLRCRYYPTRIMTSMPPSTGMMFQKSLSAAVSGALQKSMSPAVGGALAGPGIPRLPQSIIGNNKPNITYYRPSNNW